MNSTRKFELIQRIAPPGICLKLSLNGKWFVSVGGMKIKEWLGTPGGQHIIEWEPTPVGAINALWDKLTTLPDTHFIGVEGYQHGTRHKCRYRWNKEHEAFQVI